MSDIKVHISKNLIFGKMNNRIFSLTAALVLALSSFAASIETDRSWYLAGEAMKISVTLDDAVIAYAELCDTHRLASGVSRLARRKAPEDRR